jgi:alkylation response protein AidB-like acyl-CoA dehydrogenase
LWSSAGRPESTAARVADAWIGARAYQLYTFGTVTRLASGAELGPESSVNKLFWSHLDVALHETALDLLGPSAELRGPWTDGWLFSLAGPIYGGTDQIQRTIVAERLLGLPKGDR